MANWLESDARPISAGWGPEPQLSAPNIGELVKGVLANRLGQQKLTQDTLSEAIKQFQARQQASAFGSALQNAGVVPQGVDVSGMSSADLARLAQGIREQTPDTDLDKLHQAMANWYNQRPTTGGGGVPRYDYHGVLLTGAEYQRRLDQDKATQNYGALSAQEADAQARQAQYEKQYGVNTDSGGLNAPPFYADQATKDKFAKDQAAYFQAVNDATRIRTQKQNYEKWYKGIIQSQGANVPGGGTDDEDGDGGAAPPQTGAGPSPPPNLTPSPIPYDQTIPGTSPPPSVSTSTPRPNMPNASAGAPVNTPPPGAIAPNRNAAAIGQAYYDTDGSVKQRMN